MPYLITLTTPSDIYGSPPRWNCHSTSNHSGGRNEEINCVCPLIYKLVPKRLVLGNQDTDPNAEIRRTTVRPPLSATSRIWLKEVVILSTSDGIVDIEPGHTGARESPIRFVKLTFVLHREEFWIWPGDVMKRATWPLDLLWRRIVHGSGAWFGFDKGSMDRGDGGELVECGI